ncbi:GNAT family N-acetyltransferase [Nocardia aurantiaca]|nr:GNAT family N-acetyltransferase [Nocardia aurantiaca]
MTGRRDCGGNREFASFCSTTLSAEQVTEIITKSEKDFAAANFGFWGLRETGADGLLLGTAGLRRLGDGPELEAVYSVDPHHRGRGLAREAVVTSAFEVLGLDRVLAEIDEGNTASIAVVERLGMRPFETVPGALGPMIHYSLTNPDQVTEIEEIE